VNLENLVGKLDDGFIKNRGNFGIVRKYLVGCLYLILKWIK
jgi:hypothetical protein